MHTVKTQARGVISGLFVREKYLRFKSFQVDVRNLIIDLDAAIKADTMMAGREKVEGGPVPPPHPPHTSGRGTYETHDEHAPEPIKPTPQSK